MYNAGLPSSALKMASMMWFVTLKLFSTVFFQLELRFVTPHSQTPKFEISSQDPARAQPRYFPLRAAWRTSLERLY